MKQILNEVRFRVLSRSCNEAFCRSAVAAFVAQLDPTMDELADIKTAVSEAVTNCIVHAYADDIGYIYVVVRYAADGQVQLSVRDTGKGIADIRRAMQPMFTTSAETERSGLGFSVMQEFMDTLRVRSAVGKGTTVTMTKKLKRCGGVLADDSC